MVAIVKIVRLACSLSMIQLDIFKSVLNIDLLTKRLKMLFGSLEDQLYNIYLCYLCSCYARLSPIISP